MTHMTDANDVKCGEGLVGLIRRDGEGKYLQKNFCGKAAGRAQWIGLLSDEGTSQETQKNKEV